MAETQIRCIIIDDEQDAIEQLKNLLLPFKQVKVEKCISDSEKVLETVDIEHPDLIFLDIQMPGKNGISLLKDLSELNYKPYIVMVTAYNEYIIDSFRNNAFDYLLKPIDRKELSTCIARIDKELKKRGKLQDIHGLLESISNKIVINGQYETFFINLKEIFYLEADGRYTDIHLLNGSKITVSQNLGRIHKEINKSDLKRISKSHVINTEYIHKINNRTKTCHLQNNGTEKELLYSKRYLTLNNQK